MIFSFLVCKSGINQTENINKKMPETIINKGLREFDIHTTA